MSKSPSRKLVSIVIPCLNEARTIAQCVNRAQEALDKLIDMEGEVVVADNGSQDNSRELAKAAGARVVEVAERGYGSALIGGFEAARGNYLVMGDADLSYDFAEAVPLIRRLKEGADLCVGNRFAGNIFPGAMPWKNRYIGNPALSGILRLLFGTDIRDAHCGIRALTRECFDALRLSSSGMEFASEMVIKAALLRMRIEEVPVTLSPDQRGRPPHLRPLRDGWRHLRFMLMLSPTWLFLLPAAIFAMIGLGIIIALMIGLDQTMVRIGPLAFGNHWMIASSAAVIISFQLAFFGFSALLYSVNEGWRSAPAFLQLVPALTRLEYWLVVGSTLAILGLLWAAAIAINWVASGFGAMEAIRPLSVAFTLVVVGIQTFFGGFLISIISGARARFVEPPRKLELTSPSNRALVPDSSPHTRKYPCGNLGSLGEFNQTPGT